MIHPNEPHYDSKDNGNTASSKKEKSIPVVPQAVLQMAVDRLPLDQFIVKVGAGQCHDDVAKQSIMLSQ